MNSPEEYSFIQEYISDFLDLQNENLNKCSMIKESPKYVQQEVTAAVNVILSTPESDAVFVDGEEESVGTCIKRHASKLYNQYDQLKDTDNFECLCLGSNSILDLTKAYPNGQSQLFTSDQWSGLQQRFKTKKERIYLDAKVIDYIQKVEKKALTDLPAAYRMAKLDEVATDEEDSGFIYFMYAHAIDLMLGCERKSEISNGEFEHNVIRIWTPVIEYLFGGTSVRAKWENIKRHVSSQASSMISEIDLLMVYNISMQEIELAGGKLVNMGSGRSNINSHHTKVLMQGKLLVDRLANAVEGNPPPMIAMEIYGPELIIYDIALSAPNLYVVTTVTKQRFPENTTELPKLRNLIKRLLSLKQTVLKNCEVITRT